MGFEDYKKELQKRKEAITKEVAEEFLTELKALSEKYGIVVNGCGCCGSPFLELAYEGYEYALEDFYGGYSITYTKIPYKE